MPIAAQLFLAVAAAAYALAALSHAGTLFSGWEHARAATAEAVLAAVLALAGAAAWRWPQRARSIALAALGFALFGTLVGTYTIAVGIGPQTRADLGLHALLLLGLALSLGTTWRLLDERPP